MTNIDAHTKINKRLFNFNWMPSIRIAIPVLDPRSSANQKDHYADRVERDDLLELFQSDLSGMKSLKSKKAQHNVIQLRPFRVAACTELDRAA